MMTKIDLGIKIEKQVISGELEGCIPAVTEHEFYPGYKITFDGQVLGKYGEPLLRINKPRNKAPYVRLMESVKKDDTFKKRYKEYNVIKLMQQHFGAYLTGYSETKKVSSYKKKFKIVPKDDDRNNVSGENLHYVEYDSYRLAGTIKDSIIKILSIHKLEISDEQIAEAYNTSIGWVNKIRTELKNKGKGDTTLNTLNIKISHDMRPIYKALLLCEGLKSNLILAKEIRPDENFIDKENKERLTEKVVRVRKKLVQAELIKVYNTYNKDTNIKDVKEKLVKALIHNKSLGKEERKSHNEIATLFSLDKTQVDNISRNIK